VMADHVNGRIGDAIRVPVGIAREEGFQEDVEVSARNLPPGWSVKPLVIANGHDKGELEVRREDGSATAGSLEIAGNSQPAVVPPLLTEDGLGYLERPRTKVSVSFVESPLFSLRIEEPFSGFVIDRKGAARIEIAVGVDRAKGFDGELTLGLEDLPDGVAVSEQAPEHLWIRTDPQIVKPGRYRIAARATAKYQGREATEVSAGIRLQVK
jgi:hypothetical protein